MQIDWRGLVRNRWTWVAAGGGALVGLVVYLRRRGSGGGYGVPAPEEAPGYGPGGLGFYDSTGADIAAQLGQREASWQAMFDQFSRDVNDRLAQIPADGPEAPVISPQSFAAPPPPAPMPVPAPPSAIDANNAIAERLAHAQAMVQQQVAATKAAATKATTGSSTKTVTKLAPKSSSRPYGQFVE